MFDGRGRRREPDLSPLWARCRGYDLASDGRCKTFDAKADSMVRSEGCGAVVLKRLSDAVADRDRIAVIRGSTVIRRPYRITARRSVTAPGHAKRRCDGRGDFPVETHGTGTVGIIEVEALAGSWRAAAEAGTCYWAR
jgi:myxalamid-type polyketide synthase MxaE and MxaD